MVLACAGHVWATLRLVDACLALSPQQLETTVPGTYGSILDTLRHCIGSDAWDLCVATGDRASLIDEDDMYPSELRAVMESHGPARLRADAWRRFDLSGRPVDRLGERRRRFHAVRYPITV